MGLSTLLEILLKIRKPILAFLMIFPMVSILRAGDSEKLLAIPIKKGEFLRQKTWIGSTEAENRVDINALYDMVVEKAYFQEGQKVKKGDKLIQISKIPLEKALSDARSQLELKTLEVRNETLLTKEKNDNFARKKILFTKKIIAQKEYEQAFNEVQLAETNLESKKIELNKLRQQVVAKAADLKSGDILASESGSIIGLLQIKTGGENIKAGTKLLSISKSEKLVFRCDVEEEFTHRLSTGQVIDLKLKGIEDILKGKVAKISSQAQKNGESISKKFLMQINFDKTNPGLKEGLSGEATVLLEKKADVYLIPIAAIRDLGGESVVLASKNKDMAPTKQTVTLGLRNENEVEIVSGLQDKEWVFIDDKE
ncbi:MAG: efflux RND transporter periplasmic adaptor subunit [Oligoflexales bacterium]|nr:efflux RND transporter periplasmic adaptor subunit [Oligoflexales bacterium]